MSSRNFGLRPPGQINPRQPNGANPLSQVRNRNTQGIEGRLGGTVQHSQVTNKFTTYCVLALGYDKKKPPPPKAQLIRHILNILRHGDDTLAIIPYDKKSDANSIGHVTHVPSSPAEMDIYFPEFTHYPKRYWTKCRITSTIPVWMISSKVFQELRANDFWVNPTSLKCQSSEKCGFMLYAHPFITQQSTFRKFLVPILLADWGENTEYEYDFQAEKIGVKFNGTTVSTKVFLIRTNPKFTSHLQQTMSRLFAQDSTKDLGPLHRYKFIPPTSNAVVLDDMLQGLLRSQQAFSENIFGYVYNNIENIDFQFDVPTPNQQENEEQSEQQNQTTHKLSLREWFYALEASDNTNMIHVVYSMSETTTIKILCERSKRFTVLEFLHNILELVNESFPEGSQAKYFPNYKSSPFIVEKFPKVSAVCGTYANELADFTTGDPQGDLPDSDAKFSETSQDRSTSSSTKRNRQGEPIHQQSVPAAAAPSGLPQSVLQQIESNQKRLNNLQIDHETHITTIGSIEAPHISK